MVAGIDNGVSENFDQENHYDFVGRLKFNRVGHLTGTRPYEQTLGYDAFSNLTSRYTTLYNFDQVYFTASYANNRKSSGGSQDSYDVAGTLSRVTRAAPIISIGNSTPPDALGNGARVARGEAAWKKAEKRSLTATGVR